MPENRFVRCPSDAFKYSLCPSLVQWKLYSWPLQPHWESLRATTSVSLQKVNQSDVALQRAASSAPQTAVARSATTSTPATVRRTAWREETAAPTSSLPAKVAGPAPPVSQRRRKAAGARANRSLCCSLLSRGESSWVQGDCEEISSAECPAG